MTEATQSYPEGVEAIAKTIWLSEFERAFSRTPTDPWENQSEKVKEGHLLTAQRLIDAGYVGVAQAPTVRLEARPADDSHEWTEIFPAQLEWAAKQGHQVRAIEIAQAERKLCWARPLGVTMDSMRRHVLETGLADLGDTILVWVNEGDFWMLALNGCEMKEYKNPDGPPLPSTDRETLPTREQIKEALDAQDAASSTSNPVLHDERFPSAAALSSNPPCTCAAIVNPNIPHARSCPLSSTEGK